MESRFGQDFSQVRVHTDSQAADSATAVSSRAYTVGRDIVFGRGEYAPESDSGRSLLAHELAHVVQQGRTSDDVAPSSSHVEAEAQADAASLSARVASPASVRPSHRFAPTIQRKLKIQGPKEAGDFQWLLTENDAKNFATSGKAPQDVSLKTAAPGKLDDPFRFNILKTIIADTSETLLVRAIGMDTNAPPHDLFKDGKLKASKVSISLRAMGRTILGAGGVTIPSKGRALASDILYSGPVTPNPNESWILYSETWALAHEFGHAFLLFSGASWEHEDTVAAKSGIRTPAGATYAGGVNEFIRDYVEEQTTDVLTPESGLHFSPTAVRKWWEPPPSTGFTGTWLQFKDKHPGAKVSVETVRGKKVLHVCVPGPGEICP